MNALWKSISGLVSRTAPSFINYPTSYFTKTTVPFFTNNNLSPLISGLLPIRFKTTIQKLRNRNLRLMHKPLKKPKNPLGENTPFAKGIVLKTLVKKPKKPNSANRKCVLIKTSKGKQLIAYVPGVGHNLQEHQYVLVKVANLKDVPGVKVKCVRGAYDLNHVVKQTK